MFYIEKQYLQALRKSRRVFYYDLSGFDKDGFIKMFEGSQAYKTSGTSKWKEFKKALKNIHDLTVFATRSNSGQGSEILVLCISKENVNVVMFSNTYGANALLASGVEKEKFEKWFKTLLY